MSRKPGRHTAGDEEGAHDRLRLDKWIWFARFQRSREDCADLIRKGHVRVNTRKVLQPGAFVKIGDVLTLALPGVTRVVEVRALAERRGDAHSAGVLYRLVEPVG